MEIEAWLCCHVQIQMVLEVEAPHMSLKLKPGMLSSAAEEWKKQVKLTTVSPYHMKVARVLREMGMSILIEHRTADRHFSMDIALVPSDWKQASTAGRALETAVRVPTARKFLLPRSSFLWLLMPSAASMNSGIRL